MDRYTRPAEATIWVHKFENMNLGQNIIFKHQNHINNIHSPHENYMQEEILHLNKIKQGNMRGSHIICWVIQVLFTQKSCRTKVVYLLLPFMPGESCLWFWFLEESFLNPVKWLQKRAKKVSESQWKIDCSPQQNSHKNRHQQRKLRPITKHKLSKHCTSSY